MKKMFKLVALMAAALALIASQAACAEPTDAVKGIYEALLAEDSRYSQTKALYADYFEGIEYEETLDDNGFTIAVSGSEYMDGSWSFVQEGEYLTLTVASDDYNGLMASLQVAEAAGAYYGVNTELISGYVTGLNALGIENDCFLLEEGEDTTTVRIHIAGPWEMKELDQMAVDENTLYFGALDQESTSISVSVGKMLMIANGSESDVTILLGEYGGLDDLAYQSILNIARLLQPKGWEDFTAGYAELADAEEAGYSVKLDVGAEAAGEIIDEPSEAYSYALIHFGE